MKPMEAERQYVRITRSRRFVVRGHASRAEILKLSNYIGKTKIIHVSEVSAFLKQFLSRRVWGEGTSHARPPH